MTPELQAFIRLGRELAESKHLSWDLPYDLTTGSIPRDRWWDLSALVNANTGVRVKLSTFATHDASLDAIARFGGGKAAPVMTGEWIELYKAVALQDILVLGNKPSNFGANVGPSFRILAGAAGSLAPHELSSDQVQLGFNAALVASDSAKRASTLKALVARWFDATGICEHRPLAQYCTAYPGRSELLGQVQKLAVTSRRQTDTKRPAALRSELSQRHFAEKLPSEEALLELIRIVFGERPRTVSDMVRFHQVRILLTTGFRAGELVTLPAATLVSREQETSHARLYGPPAPALALRHFAEKQFAKGRGADLIEGLHHVPPLFAPIVKESVAEVLRLTAPMREMLKAQRTAGRLFPEVALDALVPWTEAYSRLSGMMQFSSEPIPVDLKTRYRANYDASVLTEMRDHQRAWASRRPHKQVREYFLRANTALRRPMVRDSRGEFLHLGNRVRTGDIGLYVLGADMESYAATHLPSKTPDMRVSQAGSRALGIEDFLFLYPARALAEEKHDAIVDLDRYFAVQRTERQDLELQLGGSAREGKLFQKYGMDEKSRLLAVNPHAIRHLQNTELFRLGVADTIISKRFNRKSPVQSYSYDHRTLAEHMDEMDPATAKALADADLGPQARKAFDLIRGGKIQGPIVKQFRKVQAAEGDDAAFAYLNAEAGALHVTPYGFCLNSFAASPCLKHLECFNACSHLVRTDSPQEQANLEQLRDRYELHIGRLRERPSAAPMFEVQLRHAEARLEGVRVALRQAPGSAVFPDGDDRSQVLGENVSVG